MIDLMYQIRLYRGIVWNAYSYMPDGFGWIDTEAATDDTHHTNVNNRSHTFNYGVETSFNNPDGVWSNMFNGIYRANLYLEASQKRRRSVGYCQSHREQLILPNTKDPVANLKFMVGDVIS